MKHVIYYHNNFGRNDGPPLYYFNVLKSQLKVDVTHLFPEGNTSRFGKFDYHWWIDYGEDGLPVDQKWEIPKDRGKTIYVCSDAHINKEGFDYRVNKAKKFDYVIVNQLRFVDEFKKAGVKNPIFLPHAAEPSAYPHFEIIKKYDVCFIGHIQDVKNYNGFSRIDALDRLFKEFPNFFFGTRNPIKPEVNLFEDASKKFCMSRVVFNISIKDDLNMRNQEILSSGAFQLTNWIPTLDLLYKDRIHLVTYKTLDEMVEKARYYINHDEEREKIARAGHEQFLKANTYKHRVLEILKHVGVETKEKVGFEDWRIKT